MPVAPLMHYMLDLPLIWVFLAGILIFLLLKLMSERALA